MDAKRLGQIALVLLVFAILTRPAETGTNINEAVSWFSEGWEPFVDFFDSLFNGDGEGQ